MKCIATKKNGENCKNSASKGSNYCYIHSFGKFRGIPWPANFTLHLTILGIVLASVSIWFAVSKGATKENQEEMMANQGKIMEEVGDVPQKTAELLKESKLDPITISLRNIKTKGNKNPPNGTNLTITRNLPNTLNIKMQLPGQKSMRDLGEFRVNNGPIEVPINLIYILYSDEDQILVKSTADRLWQDGYWTWFDKRDLLPGDNLEFKWKSIVNSADYVLVFLSKDSCNLKGKYRKELAYILNIARSKSEAERFIIPLSLNDCVPPVEISNLYVLDMRENNAYDRLLKVLSR
jgi:hypothetical protein